MSASFNCIPNSILPLCQNQSISRWFCSVRSSSHPHPSVCLWCQMKHKDQDIIFSAAAAYSWQKLPCWCLYWTVPKPRACSITAANNCRVREDVGWAERLGHARKNCPALNYKIMVRRPGAESVSFYKQIIMMLKMRPRLLKYQLIFRILFQKF